MQSAVLALGSNLGDRGKLISQAIGSIAKLESVALEGVSPIVESYALTLAGVDKTQPKFLNCVIEVSTSLSPEDLLEKLNSIELVLGRERLEKWAPRTLDIDIIVFGKLRMDTEKLVIPHPRAHERGFVLVPWALLNEKAELPGFGSVAELSKKYQSEVWVLDAE